MHGKKNFSNGKKILVTFFQKSLNQQTPNTMNSTTGFALDIVPTETKKPFEGPGESYFCNICKKYTLDFAPSAIKARDRRCRACLAVKRSEKVTLINDADRLKLKLRQNLIYLKRKEHARAVTTDTVVQILNAYNIKEQDWGKVKTIKAVFNPTNDTWVTTPVFFN